MPFDVTGLHKSLTDGSAAPLDELAALLGLQATAFSGRVLSPVARNSFRMRCVFTRWGREYRAVIRASADGENSVLTLKAVHIPKGGRELRDIYEIPGARSADDFYEARSDHWFADIYVIEEVLRARTGEDMASIELTLAFGEDCPLRLRYETLMPAANIPVIFTGDIEKDSIESEILPAITGRYALGGTLPFLMPLPLQEAKLTLSTAPDYMDNEYYATDDPSSAPLMSNVFWAGHVNFARPGLDDIWVGYSPFDHAQRFDVNVDFGEKGFKVSDLAGLVAALAGKEELPEFPSWLLLKDIALYGMVFRMQKDVSAIPVWSQNGAIGENGDGFLEGFGVSLGMELPSLPIPFFSAGSKVTLALQWEMLSLGPAAVIAFEASWEPYIFTFNIAIPSWELEARLFKENNRLALEAGGNAVFPGFLGLHIEDIQVFGSLRAGEYHLHFAFADGGEPTLPFIPGKVFSIHSVEGNAHYSSQGYGLEIGFSFTLLGLLLYLHGSYEKREDGSLVALQGGLSAPMRVIPLINELLGTSLPEESLELDITRLDLTYSALLGDGDSLSDGKERHFTLYCAVRFRWDIIAMEADATVFVDWTEDATKLSLLGALTLFGFRVAASCDIDATQGSLTNFLFEVSFEDMLFQARQITVGDHPAVQFNMENINLGKLLEGIIRIVARNANWYLPWPFKILKQIQLKKLTITFDDTDGTITAEYEPGIKILFFSVDKISLLYDRTQKTFNMDLTLGGMPQLTPTGIVGESNTANELFPMELLGGVWGAIPSLGKQVFELRYLGIGQHVRANLPPIGDADAIKTALAELKAQIKKDHTPILDSSNNWLVALDIRLLNSIDIALLMCDPNFYGAQLTISGGSKVTERFAGLNLVILYRKVTETIGVFQLHFAMPTAYRQFELGAVQITLGEIDLSIYTNGNFYIDLGFPHNSNFARSFGLAVGIFSGQGGFYLGVLNGDTSTKVPKVRAGNFGTVVELGLGLSAGVGREIRKGPLKAGAFVRVVGIFEGVFSSYNAPDGTDAAYYKLRATVGIVAKVYGEVDFVVIQVGFSVSLEAYAALTLESYRESQLEVSVALRVNAYVTILFVKISFSFSFTWKDRFTFGKNTAAPWDAYLVNPAPIRLAPVPALSPNWFDGQVLAQRACVRGELVAHYSFDRSLENRRIAFILCLHGFQENTLSRLAYADTVEETPLALLTEAALRRIFISYGVDTLDHETISALSEDFAQRGGEGFTPEHLYAFCANNLIFRITHSQGFAGEIHGIPFPLPPGLLIRWRTGENEDSYDLSREPIADAEFMQRLREYYQDLSLNNRDNPSAYESRNTAFSVASLLFCDALHMLSKTALAQAERLVEAHGGSIGIEELIGQVTASGLDDISGQISRFLLGGLRVPEEGLTSLYSYAHQQFAGAAKGSDPDEVAHVLTLETLDGFPWIELGEQIAAPGTKAMLLGDAPSVEQLIVTLTHGDLKYPAAVLPAAQPRLISPYAEREEVFALKPPITLEDGSTLCGSDTDLPDGYTAVYRDAQGQLMPLDAQAAYVVRIPLTRLGETEFYSVGALGRSSMDALYALDGCDHAALSLYRPSNAIDDAAAELLSVPLDDVFLYRLNLSLEAEKPELSRRISEAVPINSAFAQEQPGVFLSLLRDACLVNARGYVMRCTLPDHILEDNAVELTLIAQTEKGGNAILLPDGFDAAAHQPMIRTGRTYMRSALPQGQTAFELIQDEPGDDQRTQQIFNMLTYSVRAAEGITASHESLPILPQEANGKWLYSQIVPLSRFLEGDDPYRGVAEKRSFILDFAYLDGLGNRAGSFSLPVGYGYTDPLLSPAAWPRVRCSFAVSEAAGKVKLTLAFSMEREALRPESIQDAETAYRQLSQSDVKIEAQIFGKAYTLNKEPLTAFLEALRRAAPGDDIPDVILETITDQDAQCPLTLVDVQLCLSRDETLLSPILRGTRAAADVLTVRCPVAQGEKQDDSLTLARDADGALYILPAINIGFGGPSYWATPPLSTRLVSLSDVDVYEPDGTTGKASFTDIDLEHWMDAFLQDVEAALAADSSFPQEQDFIESLLAAKKSLAEGIAQTVTHITHDAPESRERAMEAFRQALLRNLYLGRRIDAVAILPFDGTLPDENASFVGQCAGAEEAVSDKMNSDGLLPVVVRANKTEAQKELPLSLTYTLTDWETRENTRYTYLTLLNPPSAALSMLVPLPYKRYPDLPSLTAHGFQAVWQTSEANIDIAALPSDELFAWRYQLCFSHKTAAQDILDVALVSGNFNRADDPPELWKALAGYMAARERLLAGNADAFLAAAHRVADAMQSPALKSTQAEVYERISYAVDHAAGKIRILEGGVISFALADEKGDYTDLLYSPAENAYILPDSPAKTLSVRLTFGPFHIAERNLMNVSASVTRNASIAGIDGRFIYRTPAVSFASPLKPSLRHDAAIDCGQWTIENFKQCLALLCAGFGHVALEAVFARRMSGDLHAHIPILYAPALGSEEDAFFNAIESWRQNHIPASIPGIILLHATFFDRHDNDYNLAELARLRFGGDGGRRGPLAATF